MVAFETPPFFKLCPLFYHHFITLFPAAFLAHHPTQNNHGIHLLAALLTFRFTKIRVNGFTEPSVLFAHPNDWQDVRLLRTADGIYIWGSPADAGPDRIWGVRVVQTTAVSENTMVTGDYVSFAALHPKRGITLQVSDSHAHYFTRGMLAVRADMRIAMVHYRPEAFATITSV